MMKIICVGKVKESFYRDAIHEYMKRLTRYHKVVIEEVIDSNIKSEGDLILRHIGSKDYVITLEIEGNGMNSLEFADMLDKNLARYSNIVFVIGGSDGLDDRVKNISNYKLSFSRLTFPHQLFRVILLEQIYRGFKILNNETYHK